MLDASRSWDPEPDVKLTSPERITMMEGCSTKESNIRTGLVVST
jgi:hypothetical protein